MKALAKYRKMRDFTQTAEPSGARGKAKASSGSSYVIQKHAASHLHYDFRLELGGVLLSWAVPKGPSLDPGVKRLAVETEPHPLEYGGFEGTIAKDQYGGGTVMVWDHGSWTPKSDPDVGYRKGHLTFSLQGEKLKGDWHLVRTQGGDKPGKSWLLFKSDDAEAERGSGSAILEREPNSALSGRDLEQIADGTVAPAKKARKAKKAPKTNEKQSKPRRPRTAFGSRKLLKLTGAEQRELRAVLPELATLVAEPPLGEQWLHEVKFDGYRVQAQLDDGQVKLFTRKGLDWTERMPSLARAFAKLPVTNALFDGEFVALNEQGLSDFQALQNSLSAEQDEPLVYYAFDLLHLNGVDLTGVPLLERKAVLAEVFEALPRALSDKLRTSEHVLGRGAEFFAQAGKLGLEGIVSKRADSTYRPGRGRDWLKVKCLARQEFVIVGYTEPGGSREHLGALLLGLRKGRELTYAGRVGTGFTARSLRDLHARLEPLRTAKAPVSNPPRGAEARGVTWVEPELVGEVAFTGFTNDGLLRHPTFQGLREDKAPEEVVLETPKRVDFPLTNPDKVLYPELGITKRELLDYYGLVAERMLPHVANRPLTLVRCPNGWGKACFFQKHPGAGAPSALRSIAIREKEGKSPYSVLDDAQGIFSLVQLGALEIHTWGSRADDFEHPDLIVFDLDPDPALEFREVIACANRLREVFESAKLESFVKTTGGKGLHVCVPIEPDLNWTEIKGFAERIAEALQQEAPDKYLAEQSKAKRRGKIYIDYLRNARGATFIAPYSTRARENAPIAVPLEWDELTPRFDPAQFTLRTLKTRLEKLKQDPFERMAKLEQKLRPERL